MTFTVRWGRRPDGGAEPIDVLGLPSRELSGTDPTEVEGVVGDFTTAALPRQLELDHRRRTPGKAPRRTGPAVTRVTPLARVAGAPARPGPTHAVVVPKQTRRLNLLRPPNAESLQHESARTRWPRPGNTIRPHSIVQ